MENKKYLKFIVLVIALSPTLVVFQNCSRLKSNEEFALPVSENTEFEGESFASQGISPATLVDNKIYNIRSRCYLNQVLENSNTSLGLAILSKSTAQAKQQVLVKKIATNQYQLQYQNDQQLSFDVQSGSNAVGTLIQPYGYWGGQSQLFKLNRQTDGSYVIQTFAGLNVQAITGKVSQELATTRCNQKFVFTEVVASAQQPAAPTPNPSPAPTPVPTPSPTPAPVPAPVPTTSQIVIYTLQNSMGLSGSSINLTPGQSFNYTLKFNTSGASLSGLQPFLHLVSTANNAAFAAISNGTFSSVSADNTVTATGTLVVPIDALGTYTLQGGLFTSDFTNITLAKGSGVTQNADLSYGNRYIVSQASVSVTATPPAVTGWPGTLKLLPIGDSMTAGDELTPGSFRSYRGTLYNLMKPHILNLDFVGVNSVLPAVGGDPDHAGWGGAQLGPNSSNSNNISDRLDTVLAAVGSPDVIVLAMGWNSIYQEANLAGQKYRDLVNKIKTARPNSLIVVATVNPQKGETEQQTGSYSWMNGYRDLNQVARELAAQSSTDKIILADLANAGYVSSDYWDGIHLFQSGADKSAQVIYKALADYYKSSTGTTPVQSPSSGAVGSFVESIINDMTLPNDGAQNTGDVSRKAGVSMGLMGRGDFTPSYWNPNNKSYKSATWWKAISPWWVILTLENNQATHTRVEVGKMLSYTRSKSTGSWQQIGAGLTNWASNFNANQTAVTGPADVVSGSLAGNYAYKVPAGTDTIHGGLGTYSLDPASVSAIVTCVTARLVVDSKTNIDDRSKALYAIWVGSDWYPDAGFNVQRDVPEIGWVPAVGWGRLKKVTNEWQTYCMSPIDPPGRNDGDSNSAGTSTPVNELRNNPPPITMSSFL